MQACKTASSEIHNQRQKTLSYVRKDLSHLNSYKVLESISDCDLRIRSTYQQVVGQKMQPAATPIEEAVIVVDKDATLDQLIHFGELCRDQLGITPIQYYLHFDEGHYDVKTHEWKPNYHGHIIFDTTCHEHVKVQRQVKKNGKVQKGPEGKPLMHEVDNFGKVIRLTPADMSLMQDLAAEVTGLKRGVSSDAVHLDAQRFKVQIIAEQSKSLEKENALLCDTNAILSQSSAKMRHELSRQKIALRAIGLTKSVVAALKKGFDRVSIAIGISPEFKKLQATVESQAGDLNEKTAENDRLKAQLQEVSLRRDELQRESNRNLYRANNAETIGRERNVALAKVAYRLVGLGGDAVTVFEKIGIPDIIGKSLWEQVKKEMFDRKQSVTHSRGMSR